jgi:hypothetical protein
MNMLDTITKSNPEQDYADDSAKDPTSAERSRRYRARKRDAPTATPRVTETVTATADTPVIAPTLTADDGGETIMVREQAQVTAYFNTDGNLVLRQANWPDEDSYVVIARENILSFIDRLTDAVGVPSLR